MESLSESCSLRSQMVGAATQQLCDALLAVPLGDWNKERVLAVLAETVEAFPKEERMDPLSVGSRKSLEDFVKVVLLQPVLKDAELDNDPQRPLYGLGGAEHSEFMEALKKALLVQMKAAGKKIRL